MAEATKSISKEEIVTMKVVPEEAISSLSQGLKELCEKDINTVHDRVKEILKNQGVLRDSTQNELTQIQECSMLTDITKTFEDVKLYQKKLINMKKDMSNLLERVEKTKTRAEKLKLQKEREELDLAREKEKQRKYEKDIMARPAVEYSKNSPNTASSSK